MAAHQRVRRNFMLNHLYQRIPRVFRDRSNPLENYTPEEIFCRFRFRPQTIMYIMTLLNITQLSLRNCAVPPLLQLLVTVRFLATGSAHITIGDTLNLSRSTVGRIVRHISKIISSKSSELIKFPVGEEAVRVKNEFFKIAGFPNVLGCVDGTFIRIIRPNANEGDYVNRKGYHSLNVQMCCDPTFKITSCYAAWPGSVHDSRIFRRSSLCQRFERGDLNGVLLGDSGYPCRFFLMTPLLNPIGQAMTSYNESLCRTRVLIEQTFGILKRRFQILHKEMITQPDQAVIYTVACAVLHNIGINEGDIIKNSEKLDNDDDEDNLNINNTGIHQDGTSMRNHIINTFFS